MLHTHIITYSFLSAENGTTDVFDKLFFDATVYRSSLKEKHGGNHKVSVFKRGVLWIKSMNLCGNVSFFRGNKRQLKKNIKT